MVFELFSRRFEIIVRRNHKDQKNPKQLARLIREEQLTKQFEQLILQRDEYRGYTDLIR